MASYVLLYGGGSMPETPEEQAKVMQAWDAWFGQLGSSLQDGGNPFTGVTKTIKSDGSVSDGGTAGSGYSIIEATSIDDAVAKAQGCPVLGGGANITVFETFKVM